MLIAQYSQGSKHLSQDGFAMTMHETYKAGTSTSIHSSTT